MGAASSSMATSLSEEVTEPVPISIAITAPKTVLTNLGETVD
jgi:hypothetical protein